MDWTYGGMFIYYCPVFKHEIEFNTYLNDASEISPRIIQTINEFLAVSEEEYQFIEERLFNIFKSTYLLEETKMDFLLRSLNVDESNLLRNFIENDWIQIELLWDDIHQYKNNYVKVGFYYPTDDFATYIVFENGQLKAAFAHDGKDEYPTSIFS